MLCMTMDDQPVCRIARIYAAFYPGVWQRCYLLVVELRQNWVSVVALQDEFE
jgi:hypothetical protein